MRWTRPLLATSVALSIGIFTSYWAFNSYIESVAQELIGAFIQAESASIQQGNLLSSFAKLQSSVKSSKNLAGIAIFDLNLDRELRSPLLLIGRLPPQFDPNQRQIRIGLFDRIFTILLKDQKLLVFYFQPRFILYTFVLSSLLMAVCLLGFALLGTKIESIRTRAQIQAFKQISEQISHDIKSPLSALNLYSDTMAKKGLHTQLLKSATQRIEEILSDLKQKSEELESNDSLFRLDQALDQIIVEKQAEYPNHRLIFERHEPVSIKGNSSHFKRAISNLLNNACEASSSDQDIQLKYQLNGQGCVIMIIDKGKGIPIPVQNRLFERGFTSGKPFGKGLGLHYARRVIESMNGSLSLESKVGKGTILKISLNKYPLTKSALKHVFIPL